MSSRFARVGGVNDTSWRGRVEGWPIGLWLVAVALLTAALVVPRHVEPLAVPLPRVDRSTRARELAETHELADRAAGGLPREVRAVGEAFRRSGRAHYRKDPAAGQFRKQLRRLAGVALEHHGIEALRTLAALQSRLFVRASHRAAGGDAHPRQELEELGGALFARGYERGWLESYPEGASDDELHALFAVHYAEAVGLDVLGFRFAPTLNDWRVYYRFLLRQPLPPPPARTSEVQGRLAQVAALSRHDPAYPRYLANGILHFQDEDFPRAAAQLRLHLRTYPDGPWTLRARNYLSAAGAKLSQ